MRFRTARTLLAVTLLLGAAACDDDAGAPTEEDPVTDDGAAADDAAAAGDGTVADEVAPPSARERRATVDEDPRITNEELLRTFTEAVGGTRDASLSEQCVPNSADATALEPTGEVELLVGVVPQDVTVDQVVAELAGVGIEVVDRGPLLDGDLDDGGTVSVLDFGGPPPTVFAWVVADPDRYDDLDLQTCQDQIDQAGQFS